MIITDQSHTIFLHYFAIFYEAAEKIIFDQQLISYTNTETFWTNNKIIFYETAEQIGNTP